MKQENLRPAEKTALKASFDVGWQGGFHTGFSAGWKDGFYTGFDAAWNDGNKAGFDAGYEAAAIEHGIILPRESGHGAMKTNPVRDNQQALTHALTALQQ